MKTKKILILGAGGRDFHNFLVYFKDNQAYHVVCFTAAQIPGIEKRVFPKELAGHLYKRDIPIFPESKLYYLIKKFSVDEVILAYSDLSFSEVMTKASISLAAGASFTLLGPNDTMLKSRKPVIAITAVRTGAGKSQTSRKIGKILQAVGKRVVAIRHPMPYGHDLKKQIVERFASETDLVRYNCTVEEREEYEPWINAGIPIYAGVDYAKILALAEKEADIIIWDGGNNDWSFIRPDLSITVVDPHRAGHELLYHPGTTNFLNADIIVINKVDSAKLSDVQLIEQHIAQYNPKALVIKARSRIFVDKPELIKGKRVCVVEDGPTVTHGGMSFGAGFLAAQNFKARSIINARKYAIGTIKDTYKKYPHLHNILPAMGYNKRQLKDLEKTINKSKAEAIIDASPVTLASVIKTKIPMVDVTYELEEIPPLTLKKVLKDYHML